jgi:hypothetical protein
MGPGAFVHRGGKQGSRAFPTLGIEPGARALEGELDRRDGNRAILDEPGRNAAGAHDFPHIDRLGRPERRYHDRQDHGECPDRTAEGHDGHTDHWVTLPPGAGTAAVV